MDLRQLSYFVAVIESRSFTAAAEVLHVSQPALSQHILRLEQDLDQALMIRHSRGVEPTAAGLLLLDHARHILRSVETARREVRSVNDVPQSEVRLGMPRSLCETFGIELLAQWPQHHPAIRLQVTEQLSDTLVEWLLANRLDIALTYSADLGEVLSGEPLLRERLCAVSPPGQGTGGVGEIRFADLAREPLILQSPAYVNRQIIDTTARYCSVNLNVTHDIDSIDLTLDMVEAGLGHTIQPYLTVRRLMESGRVSVRLLTSPDLTRRLHITHARKHLLLKPELVVWNSVKEHLSRFFEKGRHALFAELEMEAFAALR